MKGRCMGVSLFRKSTKHFYNKTKKSFPGVQVFLFCPHIRNKKETPLYTWRSGSITIEASIIIPLLVSFFCAVLFFFHIMKVQLVVQGALEQTGRNLAMLSVRELEEGDKNVGYLGLAKGMVFLSLQDEEVVEQFVAGGAAGVGLLASEFVGDYILLNANYIMKFPLKILGDLDFLVCQKTQFRKWNGWHSIVESSVAEDWVYVTEYGEVYHIRRSCPYLELSIQMIPSYQLGTKRNWNGDEYEACGRCVEGTVQSIVYVTNYGDKYHCVLECSGLKRTIYQKKFSEVGGMDGCKKCSK